jgi:hypothetical protein
MMIVLETREGWGRLYLLYTIHKVLEQGKFESPARNNDGINEQ